MELTYCSYSIYIGGGRKNFLLSTKDLATQINFLFIQKFLLLAFL